MRGDDTWGVNEMAAIVALGAVRGTIKKRHPASAKSLAGHRFWYLKCVWTTSR